MLSIEFRESISDVLDILEHMEKEYVEKIPEKFMKFLEENRATQYVPYLDHSKKLTEMNLKEKTKDILAVIYMYYWCTPKEKEEYIELLKSNERIYQEVINEERAQREKERQKAKQEREEKNKEETKEKSIDETPMVYEKESVFKRMVRKIKRVFGIK